MVKKTFSLQTETEAMQKIAIELEKLPQESKVRIVNWLSSIVGKSGHIEKPPTVQRQEIPEKISAVGPSYQRGESIKDFFHNKQPRNNYQKLAILGYYLEFMKGKDEFNSNDLKMAWRLTREALPTPQVFSNSVNNTITTYNYFVAGSKKGLYRIGIRGQNLVETLPEQQKNLIGSVKKKRKKSSSRKTQK